VIQHAQEEQRMRHTKNIVGLVLKELENFIQTQFDVHDFAFVEWQVIGHSMAMYIIFQVPEMDIMGHTDRVVLISLHEASTIELNFKVLNDLTSATGQGF